MGTKTIEKATEVNEETPEQLMKEAAKMREEARAACGEEINTVLETYGCSLTAQMTIDQAGAYPQVLIVDARKA